MHTITAHQYAQVLQKLHFDGLAYWQNQDGSYYAGLEYIARLTADDIAAHVAGSKTFAIPCSVDGCVRFIAFDIDAHAAERVPILARAIRELGGPLLADAALITGGSDAGRAKVLITTKAPIPRALADHVQACILAVCERDSEFHGRERIDLACRIVRVAGRNLKRGGNVETISTLCGADACDVRPISEAALRAAFADPIDVKPAHSERPAKSGPIAFDGTIPAHIAELLAVPWKREDTRVLRDRIFKIACFFSSAEQGESLYRNALEHVQSVSPALREPSKTNRDKRSPVDRELREMRAWAKAQGAAFTPHDATSCDVSHDDLRRYRILCSHVLAKFGQAVHCFEMSLREVQSVVGYNSPESVRKLFERLERDRLLVVHHAGRAHTRDKTGLGKRGLPKVLGLIGIGDTPESVREAASRTQRIAKREKSESPAKPHGRGWNGVHCAGCLHCYA